MALQNVEANITLDLYNHDTTPATVKAIQLDSETRYVAARLQNVGVQYDVDSGATVQLIVVRPDKVGVQITGTTFTYGDESSEYLGPYAELTQVALAVSGKMRGQFKITSGNQILRTEIFSISNGEALDASTDEWADEYDGYNLEEMATSIETNTADIATLEADVSQIKEDFNELKNDVIIPGTTNLYPMRSDDMLLSINENNFSQGSSLYGFYVPINPSKGTTVTITRTYVGQRFRAVSCHDIPAVGTTYAKEKRVQIDGLGKTIVYDKIESTDRYLYIAYYSNTADTRSQDELLDGIEIFYGTEYTEEINKITRLEESMAGKLDVHQGAIYAGEYLLIADDGNVTSAPIEDKTAVPGTKNLYAYKSDDMLLSIENTSFGQGTTLYGFYVPIDPTKGTTITVKRNLRGKRFRIVACQDVPAVGTTYKSSKRIMPDDTANVVVYDLVEPTDRYLYIAYYGSSADTYSKEQLLAGMTIFYGTEYVKGYNRLDRLDFTRDDSFINAYVDSSGNVVESAKHILSDYINTAGTFGISCPSNYIITGNLYNSEGEYETAVTVTDQVKYITNEGKIRVCIEASDSSDVTSDTVDFSSIKIPRNNFSAYTYANKQTNVLDAENSKCADVYAYIDSAMKSHGMYVTKTFLASETSGLPVYYYTLGNGSKKMMIISGQHGPGEGGDPRDSVINVAKLVHDLITGNFSDDSFLKTIHDECTLLVIPVLNPYGFDNRKRTDASGDDINRDWTNGSKAQVSAAKSLITNFDPFMILDVHCNGTTPIVNADIEIQFGLGATHNPIYKSAVQQLFKSYYNTDVAARIPNSTDTLQYYIQNVVNKLGGLLEVRWWTKDTKWLHDEQAESADYAMIVNTIKYCYSVNESISYVFEHTPNQNQY